MYDETNISIQNMQKVSPLNCLDHKEYQIQYNLVYLIKTIISVHLSHRQCNEHALSQHVYHQEKNHQVHALIVL
jgi:hypothetical protein